ncbi:MAG: hypothetical protein AAF682_13535 [Planctomycetota bacterium]
MKSRLAQLLLAELLAFGAFVAGGLALVGAAVTWSGESRQPTPLSWLLVVLFAAIAIALGRVAAARLWRVVFRPAEPSALVRVRHGSPSRQG